MEKQNRQRKTDPFYADASARKAPQGAASPDDLRALNEAADQATPYSLAPEFLMVLSGDWETGGAVELFVEDQRLQTVRLTPGPWAILATLFSAAIHSQTTHWLRAFVPTKRLIDVLNKYDLALLPTAQNVHAMIHRIRSKLAKGHVRKFTSNAHLNAKEWVDLLVENGRHLGYRIGLPPSQLRLTIGDTDHTPPNDADSETEGREKETGSPKEFPACQDDGDNSDMDDFSRKAQ